MAIAGDPQGLVCCPAACLPTKLKPILLAMRPHAGEQRLHLGVRGQGFTRIRLPGSTPPCRGLDNNMRARDLADPKT